MSTGDLFRLQTDLYQALNSAEGARIQSIGMQIARKAAADFTLFHEVLNALGFHNCLELLNEMMSVAWSQAQDDPAYSQAAVESYAARATDHLIYAFLTDNPLAAQATSDLIVRLEQYFPVERARLQSYLELLSGRKGLLWSEADFKPLQITALSGLMVEFLGYAFQEGVPYARAHLVRELMPRYLLDRQAGSLQPREDMAVTLRGNARPFPTVPPQPLHPLAPDRPSLELFLQRLLQTAYPQPHAAAALLTLTPAWIRFLVFRGLISESVAQQTHDILPGLHTSLAPLWQDQADTAIRQLA